MKLKSFFLIFIFILRIYQFLELYSLFSTIDLIIGLWGFGFTEPWTANNK